MTCWRGECRRGCYDPDACSESDEQPDAIREAFALGAAWALGDDEETPAALKARIAEINRRVSALNPPPDADLPTWHALHQVVLLILQAREHCRCGCGVDGDGKCPCGCDEVAG